MCVCLLNVGVFTREDRHTDDMKNKQAGIAHEELKTDRKAWIFGGGSTIYIYIYMYRHPLSHGDRERERESERDMFMYMYMNVINI